MKTKSRIADQVQKLVHRNDECNEPNELNTLNNRSVRIEENRAKYIYSAKGNQTAHKMKANLHISRIHQVSCKGKLMFRVFCITIHLKRSKNFL